MVQCGVPAVTRSIPTRIPQLSDPSPRYSRNTHTHTHRKPADSAGFPPSQSTCTPLVQKQEGDQSITDDQDGCEWVFLLVLAHPGTPGPKAVKQLCLCVCVRAVWFSYINKAIAAVRLHPQSSVAPWWVSCCGVKSVLPSVESFLVYTF